MSVTKEELIKKIKELNYPTIQKLSKELNVNRQVVSVLLNSMKEEGTISYQEIGNNKIWRVVQ